MLKLIFALTLITSSALAQTNEEEQVFRANLFKMSSRIDKSLDLLRKQISANQSAPFIADLYLQLGQLLSQKSNVLYYIHKEREKSKDAAFSTKKVLSVVESQKEAIRIYDKILDEFPKFNKRKEVTYILALSLKSIDESIRFRKTSESLIKQYPRTKESMRTRLLLGQFYFQRGLFPEAIKVLGPVTKSKFPFERNSAKYRLGLIYLAEKKYKISLNYFEQVTRDETLKDEENPQVVSLEKRTLKTNLKKEALIDSIRAFTNVFPKNPKAVAYYSEIAPNEILFQEVIEKLAFRYVFLKKFNFAIRLLRTYTERVVNSKKVIDIYKEVLLSIPPNKRLDLDVEEMKFVLDKYNLWASYYKIPPKDKKSAHAFFEKNIRDLGTKSHVLGKKATDPKKKAYYYERARQFYHMYLGFFKKGARSVKIATNLGDVYYFQKKFLDSGDYYLRTFLREFGPPKAKRSLIKNAIMSFQKEQKYSYYEQIRVKGLLIKSIYSYFRFDRKMRKNPRLNFVLYKTQYEQGLYDRALDNLHIYMKKFRKTKWAVEAGNLVLDYYNTIADYKGLAENAKRILAYKLPNKSFNKQVKDIMSNAQLARLKSNVEKKSSSGNFQQGEAYLDFAMSSGDAGMQSVALQQALARSKNEQDMGTFFKAAKLIAKNEKSKTKKAQTLQSLADNYISVGKFQSAKNLMKNEIIGRGYGQSIDSKTFTKLVNLNLALRDWSSLSRNKKSPLWRSLATDAKNRISQLAFIYLDDPVKIPSGAATFLQKSNYSAEELLQFYKAKSRLPSGLANQTKQKIKSFCSNSSATVCIWERVPLIDKEWFKFERKLKKAKTTMKSLEKYAQNFAGISQQFQKMENTGDPQLEILISQRIRFSYKTFANYLKRAAKKNKEIKEILMQKAKESERTSEGYAKKCYEIVRETKLISPANSLCKSSRIPKISSALKWRRSKSSPSINPEPKSKNAIRLQTGIFVDSKNPEKLLDLAKWYYDNNYYHFALAASSVGQGLYSERKGDFSAIIGCSVLKFGVFNEAKYHLSNASDFSGLRNSCMAKLNSAKKGLL